jgi:hypothetical protein
MKTFLLIISIALFNHLANGQWLKGQIVELDTGIPIAYARLAILHQNKGVVSDSNGYFRIDLTHLSENDTLMVSAIGFEKIKFLIAHCRIYFLPQVNLRLELSPESKERQEVLVMAGKHKILATGNAERSWWFGGLSLGAALRYVLRTTQGPAPRENITLSNSRGLQIPCPLAFARPGNSIPTCMYPIDSSRCSDRSLRPIQSLGHGIRKSTLPNGCKS